MVLVLSAIAQFGYSQSAGKLENEYSRRAPGPLDFSAIAKQYVIDEKKLTPIETEEKVLDRRGIHAFYVSTKQGPVCLVIMEQDNFGGDRPFARLSSINCR